MARVNCNKWIFSSLASLRYSVTSACSCADKLRAFLSPVSSPKRSQDGIINQDQLGISKIYIQAKRYTENKVREKDIRNFIGAMSGDTTNGVFVTTSSFDDGAIEKTKQAHHKIILKDGFRLTDLMFEFGVGVQTTNIYEMKKVDEDFFENDE